MTKQNSYFADIQRFLILITGFVLVGACTPTESETPTPPTAVSTPTTLSAEPITTARPTSEPTVTEPVEVEPVEVEPVEVEPVEAQTIPPTSTPKPTDTPEPTQTPYPGPWPPITHDILIWADSWQNGTLKLWHHDTRELEILLSPIKSVTDRDEELIPGGLTLLSVSLDGQTIVAGRNQIDDPTLGELVWFDRTTLEPQTLVSNIPLLREVAVSPNGRSVAYTSGDPGSLTEIEPDTTVLGTVFVVEVGSSEPAALIGHCLGTYADGNGKSCMYQRLLWTLDSQELLWTDDRGVMAYHISTGNTDLFLANNYDLPEEFEVNIYRPIDWSPNGRFLRLDEGHYEGGVEVILDTQTKQLFEIPYTWIYGRPELPHGTWLADSRFLLVRPERESGEYTTIIEIWRPSPDTGQLALDGSTILPAGPQAIPKEPSQFPDGALAIGILGREPADPTSGIYRLETLFSTSEQLNQIPDVAWISYGDELFWEPDIRGILINGQYGKGELVYVPTGETIAYDMIPIIGRNIRQFYWLP